MKVNVDQDKCIGCGACVSISPENFDFNEDGLSVAISDEVTEKTINAKEACPVYAINVSEAQDETTNDNVVNFEEHKCHNCNGDCECEKEAA